MYFIKKSVPVHKSKLCPNGDPAMKRIIRSLTQTRGKEILHNLQSVSRAHAVPYSFSVYIKMLCVFGSSLHFISRLSTHWITPPLTHKPTWCHATGSKEKNFSLSAHVQNCEKRVLSSSCLSVRLSVWMEQLGSRCSDLKEILYLCVFRKSVENIQVSSKSDKSKG
jgi:hypothetical protein